MLLGEFRGKIRGKHSGYLFAREEGSDRMEKVLSLHPSYKIQSRLHTAHAQTVVCDIHVMWSDKDSLMFRELRWCTIYSVDLPPFVEQDDAYHLPVLAQEDDW